MGKIIGQKILLGEKIIVDRQRDERNVAGGKDKAFGTKEPY